MYVAYIFKELADEEPLRSSMSFSSGFSNLLYLSGWPSARPILALKLLRILSIQSELVNHGQNVQSWLE